MLPLPPLPLPRRRRIKKHVIADPTAEAKAVNFGAIATAFCWARVVAMGVLLSFLTFDTCACGLRHLPPLYPFLHSSSSFSFPSSLHAHARAEPSMMGVSSRISILLDRGAISERLSKRYAYSSKLTPVQSEWPPFDVPLK